MSTRNFKSMEAYRKWLSFGNIHGMFKNTPGNQRITIRGKPHKVIH